jgi:hypothetical protein
MKRGGAEWENSQTIKDHGKRREKKNQRYYKTIALALNLENFPCIKIIRFFNANKLSLLKRPAFRIARH